ncbi:hypothetical protein SKTS_25370 [Sulfurimicrobium lacus]|uniref:Uncharacterized protein n=1 Tax=Sulfurimicrobium lacus TaxID=2715678 RepID=A0A6F8VEQ0_9PROT|nr:hypothetical protein SKTS_25370 [Sulfurimicrobium lacus]
MTAPLFAVDNMKKQTKVASSSGFCPGLVEQIMASTRVVFSSLSPAVKSVCGCNDHTRNACGLYMGGELEHVDSGTLAQAVLERRNVI